MQFFSLPYTFLTAYRGDLEAREVKESRHGEEGESVVKRVFRLIALLILLGSVGIVWAQQNQPADAQAPADKTAAGKVHPSGLEREYLSAALPSAPFLACTRFR